MAFAFKGPGKRVTSLRIADTGANSDLGIRLFAVERVMQALAIERQGGRMVLDGVDTAATLHGYDEFPEAGKRQ